MILRVGYNLFILVSLATMPWQSIMLFIVAGFFLYDHYFEGVLWAVVLDTVSGGYMGGMYWYTLVSVAAYVAVGRAKHYIQWYD